MYIGRVHPPNLLPPPPCASLPPITFSFYFIKVLTDIADSNTSGILLSQNLLFKQNHYF